jgi:hypothetical protein
MTYEVFGRTYTLLHPAWLWLVVCLPLLWLPIFWVRNRQVLFRAAMLRSLAAVLIVSALAGLSRQTIVAEHKLAVVAAVDVSDSIAPEGRAWTQEYLKRVVKTLEPGDDFAALTFAADTHIVVPLGGAGDVTLPSDAFQGAPAGEGGATNIARALEHALMLYPEEAEKRLLLLTDGNETTDAAQRLLSQARQRDVKIFPVIPPADPHPGVMLGTFTVPPLVHEGSLFSVRLVVHNSHETHTRARVRLLVNDQLLTRQEVTVEPGRSVLEVPTQLLRRGTYLLRAEVDPVPDTGAGNTSLSASVAVAAKIRALVITDNPQTRLAAALQRKGKR